MNTRLLLTLVCAVLSLTTLQAQLTQISHEVVYTDGDDPAAVGYPTGHKTYRIYAHIGPDDLLTSVFAAGDNPLLLGTSLDDIWNSPFGSVTGDGLNAAFFPVFPESEWDSMVTIGRVNSGDGLTGSITAISVFPSATAIADKFGVGATDGQDLVIQDGTWFTTPDNTAVMGQGPENTVVLAQVTTEGDLQYELNVQLLPGGIGGDDIQYVWEESAATASNEEWFPGLKYPLDGTYGCTDDLACNYDSEATIDDGSCAYPGCTIPSACNYDPAAGCDDGSCDGVAGCMDDTACNYDVTAICESGLCTYPGCTDDTACNYDAEAGCDDGSCLGVIGCSDPLACNYIAGADCTETCIYPGCTDDSFCNYNPAAGCDDGSCSDLDGCTSPGACNYNAAAACDDGSCLFADCGDAAACNYNPDANCNNPSLCVFPDVIAVQVFSDLDSDEVWDTDFGLEPALGNEGQIYIPEAGVTLFPDEDGLVYSPPLPDGTYTLQYSNPDGAWQSTMSSDPVITLPSCETSTGFIGVENTASELSAMAFPTNIFTPNIHCVSGIDMGLWVYNNGAENIYGTVTITFDPLLVPQDQWFAEEYDYYEPGLISWDIFGQAPSTFGYYQVLILPPPLEYVGEFFTFEIVFELQEFTGEVISTQSFTEVAEVVCSYDPNDKYAVPEGYAEPNFIASTQEIEYRVRFQNTGNAPAINVRIEDLIDTETLDLSTLQPIYGSHDFSTCVMDDGQVVFNFDNINLPDSASDEDGSQGYVVYKIKPFEDLPGYTEINNTAEIYFDFNDPIITNTYTHTIIDCETFNLFSAEEDTFCGGDAFEVETGNPDYVETYTWYLDGASVGTDEALIYIWDVAGDFTIGHEISNPLCTSLVEAEITVNPAPDWTLVTPGGVCEGDVFQAEVMTNDNFQWDGLAENEVLEVILNEEMTFDLTVFTDLGCSWNDSFTVGPFLLPESTFTQDGALLTADDGAAWQWFLFGEAIDGATDQTYEATESGNYSVEVTSADGCVVTGDEVFINVVGVDELGLRAALYPNPAQAELNVQLDQAIQGSLHILNAQGVLVDSFQFDGDAVKADVSAYARGTYLVQIVQDSGAYLMLNFVKE